MSQEMPLTMSQMTNTTCALHGNSNNAQLGSSCECDLKRKAGHYQEKHVIAQPVFVYENRDQVFKRPAEDTIDKVEHGLPGSSRKRARSSSFTFHTADSKQESAPSQKRMRSSSFTVLPTFPPSQPVKKNNVFMTTTASQWNVDIARTQKGLWERSQQCPILRPAILQPPQSQRCVESNAFGPAEAMEFYKTSEKAKTELSDENLHMQSENSASTDTSVKSSVSSHLLSPAPIRSQPNEDRHSLQSHSSNFIFGENMNERVLSPQKSIELHQEKDPYNKERPFTSSVSFPLHFSLKSSCKNTTLKESAAAFSSKPSPKCMPEKIEVITGEEEEHNVLKINCKLFVFKKTTQSWTERGRGTLRLNDTANASSGMLQSRLVMRNQGSLRLILNSKLWAQMEIQRASHKNLRITATDLDDCSIKIFLIQASAKDVGCLYAAIHHRLVALRTFYKQELDVNEIETESETVIQLLSCDSCDEDDEMLKITTGRSDPSRWNHRPPVACS
ncbi:ran-binding protein 3-like isoform X1 [Trichosurus vulpecula]|uniref:ran-binding protein 3-like isoform X1 n=1 Tax=Trichosurus vulpecula TaxID=9337 RepID=UPI00186B18AA|nr:ran-binding protein 3-like isoform X1 [Trichosurus vulpecula]